MKPKSQRQYKGKGNRNNRFKRDVRTLSWIENKGKKPGYLGLRWQG